MPKLWIEEYRGCGCSIGPIPKDELVGYCATHGSDVIRRYALPQKKIYLLEIESLIDFEGSGEPICYYSKGHHPPSEFVAKVAKEKDVDIDPSKVEFAYMRWEMYGVASAENHMRIGQEYPTPGRGKFPVTIVYL